MSIQTPSPKYDRAQIEARFDSSPAFMLSRVVDPDLLHNVRDSYDVFAVRKTDGEGKESFRLATLSETQVARKVATAPRDFSLLLTSLAAQLARVLTYRDDPIALEHHAVLFWPSMNALHSFLGMDLRADELIAACDVFRSQFRLRPVPVAALLALENVLRAAAAAPVLDAASVDGWLDQLAQAGVDQSFPLTFESSDAE